MFRIGLLLLCVGVALLSVAGDQTVSKKDAVQFLGKYGYLSSSQMENTVDGMVDEPTMEDSVKEFQGYMGIQMTGTLDEETLEMMNRPRCGMPDKDASNRFKRYSHLAGKWRNKAITYKINRYPTGLSRANTDLEIARALNAWTLDTDLTFSKAAGKADIEIVFQNNGHDGPGKVLAFAYGPSNGDASFDNSETWTIGRRDGINLFQTAVHEFGHSLGLGHSEVRKAIMFPYISGYNPQFALDIDDVMGIQSRYGRKTRSAPKTTMRTMPAGDPELCTADKVDTIFATPNGKVVVFKGNKYWRLTDGGVAAGFPKPISSTWAGLPDNIDAAFSHNNRRTYFLKGTQIWRYLGTTLESGYPKQIATALPGIPNNVDTAVVYSGDGRIYFFKGSQFWAYDPAKTVPVHRRYPLANSRWGLPNNLDGAFQTNGKTYFVKGRQFYRSNNNRFSIAIESPPYPRSLQRNWFGCRT